jgi:hypothetical protein
MEGIDTEDMNKRLVEAELKIWIGLTHLSIKPKAIDLQLSKIKFFDMMSTLLDLYLLSA